LRGSPVSRTRSNATTTKNSLDGGQRVPNRSATAMIERLRPRACFACVWRERAGGLGLSVFMMQWVAHGWEGWQWLSRRQLTSRVPALATAVRVRVLASVSRRPACAQPWRAKAAPGRHARGNGKGNREEREPRRGEACVFLWNRPWRPLARGHWPGATEQLLGTNLICPTGRRVGSVRGDGAVATGATRVGWVSACYCDHPRAWRRADEAARGLGPRPTAACARQTRIRPHLVPA